jgi:hypothetical protein
VNVATVHHNVHSAANGGSLRVANVSNASAAAVPYQLVVQTLPPPIGPNIRSRISPAGLSIDLSDGQLLRGCHPGRCPVSGCRDRRPEPVELLLHEARELVRRPRLTAWCAPAHEMRARDGTEHDGSDSRHGRERSEGGDSPSALAGELDRGTQLDQWRSAKGSGESLDVGREGLTGTAHLEMGFEQRPFEFRALDIQAKRQLLPDPSTITGHCGTGVHQAVRRPWLPLVSGVLSNGADGSRT